jgi:hypothetical protein
VIGLTDARTCRRMMASTRTFYQVLHGAIHRHRLLEDLFGALRLDILIAQGATFDPTAGRPKPNAPTFEKIMGREPVRIVPRIGQESDEPEVPEPISEKAQRGLAMIHMAQLQKQSRPPVPPTHADSPDEEAPPSLA